LLTKVTLSPELIVTLDGETTPLAPMVIVAPLGPGLPPPPPGLGPVGPPLPPPQATAAASIVAVAHIVSMRARAVIVFLLLNRTPPPLEKLA
jgi:hypothetical protein